MSLVDEALARNDRFLVEIVEAKDICPFARGTHTAGRLAREVILGQPDAEALAARVAAHDDEAGAQIVLLILPELTGEPRDLERLCEAVRQLDARARSPCFALAPFHPATPYHSDTPARMVGLFRRAPDPTIQLVRYSALDAVRRRAPDGKFFFDGSAAAWAALAARPERGISEQIAHDNHERHKDEHAALAEALAGLRPR